jgi:hypothetical protein
MPLDEMEYGFTGGSPAFMRGVKDEVDAVKGILDKGLMSSRE